MRPLKTFLIIVLFYSSAISSEESVNDLSYEYFVNSDRPIKCLYGYIADKTGDHTSAIKIFEDCIERWGSVYSMIWLSKIYESGIGIEQDLARATALLKQGAETDDPAGYSSLAKYHYGVALYEGSGVEPNPKEATAWLKQAWDEGVTDAREYLLKKGEINAPSD